MRVLLAAALCLASCDAYVIGTGPRGIASIPGTPRVPGASMGLIDWLSDMLYERGEERASERCA